MPICPSISCLPSGLSEVLLAAFLTETWPDLVELFSKPVSIAIVSAGFFGLIVGWLVRGRDKTPVSSTDGATAGTAELRWRHEKLVLTERQQVEKQVRLDTFAEDSTRFTSTEERDVALRLFVLAERVREARQKVGSDHSRMIAVRDRLDEITGTAERGREAIGACRGMAEAQALRLEESREALRGISDEVLRIEEGVNSGKTVLAESTGLRKELMGLKGRILSLPQGWATSGDETDRRIRELLATVDEVALAPVREVLLVDGALTASLAGASGIDLPGAVSAAMAALDRACTAREAKLAEPESPVESVEVEESKLHAGLPVSLLSGNPFTEERPDFGFPEPGKPDPGFRDPEDFLNPGLRPAKGFHDLTKGNGNGKGKGGNTPEAAGGSVAATSSAETEASEEVERSLVLFCSNDVELWGKTVYRGARCRARAIQEFPAWAKWISIRRLDTGERVFSPVRTASLRNGQTADPFGFNGTNELFYGARHLGLFSESCPNEVETRFTYGGWGFGHRAHEIAPEVEQLQAAGWEGREIPADTVFEIVIHEELPALGREDRILEGEVRAIR